MHAARSGNTSRTKKIIIENDESKTDNEWMNKRKESEKKNMNCLFISPASDEPNSLASAAGRSGRSGRRKNEKPIKSCLSGN